MIVSHSGLTAGYVTALCFLGVAALVLIVSVGLLFFRTEFGGNYIAGGAGILLALFTGGVCIAAPWPINDSSYHRFYEVQGTVTDIDHPPFLNRYAIRLAESGQLFGCDDTRCSTLNKGDSVTLNCKKEWEYQATPGWACRWKEN